VLHSATVDGGVGRRHKTTPKERHRDVSHTRPGVAARRSRLWASASSHRGGEGGVLPRDWLWRSAGSARSHSMSEHSDRQSASLSAW